MQPLNWQIPYDRARDQESIFKLRKQVEERSERKSKCFISHQIVLHLPTMSLSSGSESSSRTPLGCVSNNQVTSPHAGVSPIPFICAKFKIRGKLMFFKFLSFGNILLTLFDSSYSSSSSISLFIYKRNFIKKVSVV